jgi:hypothetical protein
MTVLIALAIDDFAITTGTGPGNGDGVRGAMMMDLGMGVDELMVSAPVPISMLDADPHHIHYPHALIPPTQQEQQTLASLFSIPHPRQYMHATAHAPIFPTTSSTRRGSSNW